MSQILGFLHELYIPPATVVFTVAVLALSAIVIEYSKRRRKAKSIVEQKSFRSPAVSTPLRDIFAVLRNKTALSTTNFPSKNSSAASPAEKPFESLYYYAHNNPNSNAGYKDGLRMEDFVMNQPRLLAKNGVRLSDVTNFSTSSDCADTQTSKEASTPYKDDIRTPTLSGNKTANITSLTQAATYRGPGNSIPVNRYAWEDALDGTVKIQIDYLPVESSTSPALKWEDANIAKSDIESKLVGEKKRGLLVQIRRRIQPGEPKRLSQQSSEQVEQRYHFHVPQLYGDVEEVKLVVKAKRLIVKLVKKKGSRVVSWFDKSHLKPWPQLASKDNASPSFGGTSPCSIDDDVFRQGDGL